MIATIDLGVRKEEMAELTWEVQDKNRPFEVDLKKEMVTVTGKRNKIRQIPILPRTLEMLKSMPRHFNSPYVFYSPEGNPIKDQEKALENAIRRSGINTLTWHDPFKAHMRL